MRDGFWVEDEEADEGFIGNDILGPHVCSQGGTNTKFANRPKGPRQPKEKTPLQVGFCGYADFPRAMIRLTLHRMPAQRRRYPRMSRSCEQQLLRLFYWLIT